MNPILTASIISAFIISAIGLTLTNTPTAYACSCIGRTGAEYMDRADVVVTAKAVRDFKRPTNPLNIGADVALSAERYYKGSGPELIFVNDEESSCGFFWGPFDDERYIVFLRGDSEPYETCLCSGNAFLQTERGTRILREVQAVAGPGSPPTGPRISSASLWQSRPVWFGIGAFSAFAAVGLAASLAMFIRRRSGG